MVPILCPFFFLGFTPNAAGAPNINEQVVLEGVEQPPDGFYTVVPFFSYQLELPQEE